MTEEKIIRTYATVAEENTDINKMYEQGYKWRALSLGTIEFVKIEAEEQKKTNKDCTPS